jgi:rubredoxin
MRAPDSAVTPSWFNVFMKRIKWFARKSKEVCPSCGKKAAVPIAYGFPGPGMWDAVDRGEIILGGCVISPGMPNMSCLSCGWRYNSLSESPEIEED